MPLRVLNWAEFLASPASNEGRRLTHLELGLPFLLKKSAEFIFCELNRDWSRKNDFNCFQRLHIDVQADESEFQTLAPYARKTSAIALIYIFSIYQISG